MERGLSSLDLKNFLAADKLLSKKVCGIFPANKIPKRKFDGEFFIINTDTSFNEGKHWVSIYFPFNSLPEFFDSLGKCPSNYSAYILDFLIENSPLGFVRNYNRIQEEFSSSCGLYCLYFMHFRARKISFENIIKKFCKNLNENENIIKGFFSEYK